MTRDTLDPDRKRILYRANHRGIKEMDIVLGGYAERHLAEMKGEELSSFVRLMEEHDRDLIQWVTGEKPLPEHLDAALFERIIADIQNPDLA